MKSLASLQRYTAPAPFYRGSTVDLARKLIGAYLCTSTSAGVTVGRIVETEAYLFEGDPACHAARGKTSRNAAMFGRAGTCYVYLIYGMYYCFNVVSGPREVGEAVLIRALEPVAGMSLMHARRRQHRIGRAPISRHGTDRKIVRAAKLPTETSAHDELPRAELRNLCSGPGKLVIALGIGPAHNATSLITGPIRILLPEARTLFPADDEETDTRAPIEAGSRADSVVETTRVGISTGIELPLRFYLRHSPFVSKR